MNEMLEYWKWNLQLHQSIINSTEKNMEIIKAGIELRKRTKNVEIKDLIGSIELLENSRNEMIDSLIYFRRALKLAELQVKSYSIVNTHEINKN